jgi:hypothetical protein
VEIFYLDNKTPIRWKNPKILTYSNYLFIKNTDPNKILRIKTNDDVKLFTKLYRMKSYKKLSLLDSKENVYFDHNTIDWQKVSKKFGGIEFNLYTSIYRSN